MKILVQDLYFTYPGNVQAIRGISLEINPGEQVAMVGQNGSGKTTLVRHFNGLLKPTSGTVLIGDWNTRDYSVARLASRVGYVFQNPDEQLFCKTVYDEVGFGPKNQGYPKEKVQALIESALALTELNDRKDVNPYELSPTWRKMVAVASVIAMDTPVVILDEPTTGQDAVSVQRLAAIIAELRRQGKTVITITHDIDFCAENFERVIALSQGQVLLDGPAAQVLGEEVLLGRTYVEPPQLTRLAKRLGIHRVIRNQDEFLEAYRDLVKTRKT